MIGQVCLYTSYIGIITPVTISHRIAQLPGGVNGDESIAIDINNSLIIIVPCRP